jgi:hypothetical protein
MKIWCAKQEAEQRYFGINARRKAERAEFEIDV